VLGTAYCKIKGSGIGSRATQSRQSRQVRKEATVTGSCVCSGYPGAWELPSRQTLASLALTVPDSFRTLVTFQSSAFNTSEPREYFINDCCFGDDAAKWLINRLRANGIQAAEAPDQEDFGWYFTFHAGGAEHCFVLGYRPPDGEEEGTWMGWVERHCGFVASMLGRRRRGIQREAVQAIHEILASAQEIRNPRWHLQADFDKLREDLGTPAP
jgi:hypothetical protein